MNLTPSDMAMLIGIITNSDNDIQKVAVAAFEAGLKAATTRNQGQNAGGDNGGDEDDDAGPLSDSDKRALHSLGLDPKKTYIHKNSKLTIVGYKPSRWKYPISVTNQNGRRLKTSAQFLKGCYISAFE